jgi:DNA-binding response OmpR family regulator
MHSGATILVCSPCAEHRALIRTVLERDSRKVYEARSIREAFRTLARDRITAVLCQDHLPDGSWQDLQGVVAVMPSPPSVIVLSDAADEALWPEVLNLGAYDVLVTPLHAAEILRLTGLACQSYYQHQGPAVHSYARSTLAVKAVGA